jgi:quinolinate synthase
MAANIAAEIPSDIELVRPCNFCPHMRRITLPKILDSLVELREPVVVDPMVAARARLAVERMINLKS